ncbi:unnamed protein product, partial [marine sediment metagenome]
PDLKGRVAAVQDFTGEGPNDRHGHGTHCASIAAGSGAASGGEYRGAAPEASIYSAKVLGSDGLGMMSDVMAGIEWAHDQGVHVVSLSLGSSGSDDSTDALGETCDAVVDEGIVVCVAAGNEGPNPGTICTPGSARKVITVGAATEEDQVATFSSRGPTADGRPKPDVVLPGVGIIGARARGTGMGTIVNQYYSSAHESHYGDDLGSRPGGQSVEKWAHGIGPPQKVQSGWGSPSDLETGQHSSDRGLSVDLEGYPEGALPGAWLQPHQESLAQRRYVLNTEVTKSLQGLTGQLAAE